MVSCPLFPWTTSSATAADSCHVHSLSPLAVTDQVQGARYSKSEVESDIADLQLETVVATLELETDTTTLKLETDTVVLDLEMETDVSQEILQHERYSTD
jgi:hypothetical protein